MDLIFKCAEFTLTAAAGSDGTMGLPGIRSVLRMHDHIEKFSVLDLTYASDTLCDE